MRICYSHWPYGSERNPISGLDQAEEQSRISGA